MIQVSMKGTDPIHITEIVNAFADRFIDYHIEVHKVRGAIEFYSQQAKLYSKKLFASEDNLKAFEKKWGIIEIKSQRAANLDLLRMLRETLSLVNSKVAERQTKVFQLKKAMHHEGSVTARTDELRNNQLIIELTRAMIPLMVEKERVVLLYPENTVEYQEAFEKLEHLKQEIIAEQTKILSGMEFDLKAMLNQKKALEDEIRRINIESRSLTGKEIERERLIRRVEQDKKNLILYQDKMEEARINILITAESWQIC